jgi:hypothetical protein
MDDHLSGNVPAKNDSSNSSGWGLLCRLFWFFFGNVIIFILALKMVFRGTKTIFFDIFYWATVLGLILSRYLDIRYFNGQTAYSEPATMAHWKRYSLFVALITLGVWIICHGISHFLGK